MVAAIRNHWSFIVHHSSEHSNLVINAVDGGDAGWKFGVGEGVEDGDDVGGFWGVGGFVEGGAATEAVVHAGNDLGGDGIGGHVAGFCVADGGFEDEKVGIGEVAFLSVGTQEVLSAVGNGWGGAAVGGFGGVATVGNGWGGGAGGEHEQRGEKVKGKVFEHGRP